MESIITALATLVLILVIAWIRSEPRPMRVTSPRPIKLDSPDGLIVNGKHTLKTPPIVTVCYRKED